jgi:GAF domain/ANTAR domain
LCEAAVHTMPIAGASLTLTTAVGHRSLLAASDGVAARLDELHFTLGEGPAIDAVSRGHPVLVNDLADPATAGRWPAFCGAAMEAEARAVFALPLQIGAVCLGVLVAYRVEPGRLSAEDLAQALRLADGAADALLDLAVPASDLAQPDGDGAHNDNHPTYSFGAEVHQASGMLMVQLGVSIEIALARLRAYAFAQGRPVSEIAREVVAGTLLLER